MNPPLKSNTQVQDFVYIIYFLYLINLYCNDSYHWYITL